MQPKLTSILERLEKAPDFLSWRTWPRPPGGGVLAMLGYPGMCHFPGYTFCPKILKQGMLFAQKF